MNKKGGTHVKGGGPRQGGGCPMVPSSRSTVGLDGARRQRSCACANLSPHQEDRADGLAFPCVCSHRRSLRILQRRYLPARQDSWPCKKRSCYRKLDHAVLATDHSVPKNVTPSGEFLKTSWSLMRTSAPSPTSFLPARSWRRVDLPACADG